MERLKFYCDLKDLNEEEIKTNRISYRRLIERIGNIWLFNNAPKLSDYDFEFEIGSDYDEENDEYIDIYQYYLIDTNEYCINNLKEINCDNVIIAWSEKLENYVLFVPHFGTSWDYIMTNFEPTNNIDEADF